MLKKKINNSTSSNLSSSTVAAKRSSEKKQELPKAKIAVMTFKKDLHDFGKMKQGEKKEYIFEFTNTGSEDLVIDYAAGSCGCTVPDWPKKPIAPGATGKIKVEFDSTDKFGQEETEVTIMANTEPIVTSIKVKAEVEE